MSFYPRTVASSHCAASGAVARAPGVMAFPRSFAALPNAICAARSFFLQ